MIILHSDPRFRQYTLSHGGWYMLIRQGRGQTVVLTQDYIMDACVDLFSLGFFYEELQQLSTL